MSNSTWSMGSFTKHSKLICVKFTLKSYFSSSSTFFLRKGTVCFLQETSPCPLFGDNARIWSSILNEVSRKYGWERVGGSEQVQTTHLHFLHFFLVNTHLKTSGEMCGWEEKKKSILCATPLFLRWQVSKLSLTGKDIECMEMPGMLMVASEKWLVNR